MMIFGASEVSRNVDLGDETPTMIRKFEVRASDASITKEIGSDLQSWLDDLTDGGVSTCRRMKLRWLRLRDYGVQWNG